jgi:hypothetical protein
MAESWDTEGAKRDGNYSERLRYHQKFIFLLRD